MSISDFGRITGQVAEGLAAAHAAGIVHRDVKPQNILIDRNGFAKVTDFGIATGPDWTRVTRAGSVIGSARYMSPEQVRSRQVDGRSDIYSLGVVMYEMLTGHPPFDGTNMPVIARMHLNAVPPPISDIRPNLPAGLEKIVLRCLEKSPEDRFTSMDELLGALVGLGLYAPQRVPEVAASVRRSYRRDEKRSRSATRPPAPETFSDEIDEDMWIRERARELARKRRAQRRWKILGFLVVIALVIVGLVLAFTLKGGGAPMVLGLTLDEARVLAKEAGLQIEITDRVPSFDRPADIVMRQDPEAELKSKDKVLRLIVTREPTMVAVTKLVDVDPEGDNVENPDKLPNLIDGKESTVWSTELYRSELFGGLKTGVGFDFTLEGEATIIEVVSSVEGWVANLDGTTTQIITLGNPIDNGRFWFTELAKLTNNRWGVELSEIRFYR